MQSQSFSATLTSLEVTPGLIPLAARSNPPGSELEGWENWVSRPTGGMIAFIEASSWAGLVSVAEEQAATQGAMKRPIRWAVGMPSSGVSLSDVASGAGDSYYASVASAMLEATPDADHIDMRLFWEMNLYPASSYYAWSAFTAAPALIPDYITAFQRVVGVFRAQSSKFRIHWTPNSWFGSSDPELAWPGDAYVDVIGMDAYLIKRLDVDPNSGTTIEAKIKGVVDYKFTGGGRSLDWVKTFAAAHNKLVALDEFGVNLDGAEYWISRIAAWARDERVCEIGYWDQNNTGGNAIDAQNKLSTGQWPNTGAHFLREFGPFTIDTPSTQKASNTQTTVIALSASRQIREWRLLASPEGYSLIGDSIEVLPQAPAGVVLVQAVDWFAPAVTKAISVTKVPNLADWSLSSLGSGLSIWFDVADSATITEVSGACSQINDKSGFGRHASQATSSQRPTYSLTGRNGLPALIADGVDDRMVIANASSLPLAAGAMTMIGAFYASAASATGFRYIFGYADASSVSFGRLGCGNGTLRHFRREQNSTGFSIADKDVIAIAQTPYTTGSMAPSFVRADGQAMLTQGVTVGPAGATASALLFGRPAANDLWSGAMQEFALLNREISSYEARLVEGYLAAKWAGQSRLPANHPFKATAPLATT